MKTLFLLPSLFFLLLCGLSVSAQPRLKKIWQREELDIPESVWIDEQNKQLYVSLIGPGNPGDLDGNGSIAILDFDGNVLNKAWIKGLNSPKGIALYQDRLYVADLKELVIIDIPHANVIEKIAMNEVGMFNDVTVDQHGNVFVSDSKGGVIYQYKNGKIHPYLSGLVNPNGLLASDDGLYFVDSGALYLLREGQPAVKLAEGMEKSTDGLQKDGDQFLISCWAGALYHVSKEGNIHLLMNTQQEKINTADIAFDPVRHRLYLPTFFKNYVAAFELN